MEAISGHEEGGGDNETVITTALENHEQEKEDVRSGRRLSKIINTRRILMLLQLNGVLMQKTLI
jgi:hypothetical protein